MNGGNQNSFAGFNLDVERKVLRRGNEIVPLPLKAIELLIVLLKNKGRVLTKNELLDAVWEGTFVEEAVLSNNVYILRKTLSEMGAGKDLIQTVPRRGYRFVGNIGEADESEIVVEQHVFRQELIGELLGESESHAPDRILLNENSRALENESSVNYQQRVDEKGDRINNLPAKTNLKPIESTNSIAVLPLVNDSGDPDLDYLSDGIAESLIDNLSLLPRLRVIARTTVFRYKPLINEVDPQQIGADLDVEAVVTGKVRLFKGDLIMKIELVRTMDSAQLWGEQYNRELKDVLNIQTEIAQEISTKLQLKLTRSEIKHFPRTETINLEAYHHYLKGRYFWNKRTAEWMKKGIECFQNALDSDPNYAAAYSGLADSYVSFAVIGALSPSSAIPKAKAAAQKALEINDQLAEAHATLAFIKNNYDWDYPAAEKHFNSATEINPNYSIAYHWQGICLVTKGKFSDSIEFMKQAQMLDPLSPIINTVCGLPFYYMRRFERAIEIYSEVLEIESSFFPAYGYLSMAYEQNGQYDEAVSALLQALSYAPENTFALTQLGQVYAISGNEEKALETIEYLNVIKEKKYVSAYGMAEIYTAMKEKEQALTWLEKATDERSWWLIFAGVNPRFDALRNEPRFQTILQQLNLNCFL